MRKSTLALLLSAGVFSNANAINLDNPKIDNLNALPYLPTETLVLPDILNPDKSISINQSFNRQGPTIQIAIILDTSGSMNGLIHQAKSTIWNIVNEVSKANKGVDNVHLEVALYQYGYTPFGSLDGYTRQISPLTQDLDLLSEGLFGLRTNGGEEYGPLAIQKAISELAWSNHPDDLKLIIVAGNEEFQQGDVSLEQATFLAKHKGIKVNTIYCGNKFDGMRLNWRQAANYGMGQYLHIDHNAEIHEIVTPYDEEIARLGNQLNATYVGYGHKGQIAKMRQERVDSQVKSASVAQMATRSLAKSSNAYEASSWDIISSFDENEELALSIASNEEAYQGKSESDLKAELKLKSDERKDLESKIQSLGKKRQEWIEANKISTNNDFGSALVETVNKQALSSGFHF